MADTRTCGEDLVTKVAKRVIDQAARGFGRIAAAPERHADPVTDFWHAVAQIDTTGAENLSGNGNHIAGSGLRGHRTDPLPGIINRIGMGNARSIFRDAAVIGKRRHLLRAPAARCSQAPTPAFETRAV